MKVQEGPVEWKTYFQQDFKIPIMGQNYLEPLHSTKLGGKCHKLVQSMINAD